MNELNIAENREVHYCNNEEEIPVSNLNNLK